MIDLLNHIHPAPRRILDAGCYRGDFARECRARWPDAWITCIDLNGSFYDYVMQTADEFYRALLYRWDDELLSFRQRRDDLDIGSMGNSIYREKTQFFDDKALAAGEVFEAEMRSQSLASFKFEPFDLIKLDLQGAEADAILGGGKLISQAKHLICELHRVQTNEGAPDAVPLIKMLGFKKLADSIADAGQGWHVDVLWKKVD